MAGGYSWGKGLGQRRQSLPQNIQLSPIFRRQALRLALAMDRRQGRIQAAINHSGQVGGEGVLSGENRPSLPGPPGGRTLAVHADNAVQDREIRLDRLAQIHKQTGEILSARMLRMIGRFGYAGDQTV